MDAQCSAMMAYNSNDTITIQTLWLFTFCGALLQQRVRGCEAGRCEVPTRTIGRPARLLLLQEDE